MSEATFPDAPLSARVEERLGSIPRDHYFRDDILEREVERVFRPSWVCVGFKEDLQQHQDFVTAEYGRLGLVVQNFHGELHAFRNVCSHRYARIQSEACGNRALQCPYHGWTYDARGVPVGLPMNKSQFGFDAKECEKLRLERFAVDSVGHFVFVRMSEMGPSLPDFLGSFFDDLEHVSSVCPDRFEKMHQDWEANWKIGMDNAAEGYHVPLVHPESFGKILPLELQISTDQAHSRYVGPLKEQSLAWWQTVSKAIELQPSRRYPEYSNFLIFPNVVVTYSFGAFLTFQTFEPLGPHRLRIHSTAWLAHNNGRGARNMVIEELKRFSAQVRNEDRNICALAQRGTRDIGANRPLILGELEGRIRHFQEAYMRRMQEGME